MNERVLLEIAIKKKRQKGENEIEATIRTGF